ncbi:MAG: D-alanine--D-alanine ligase [Myxococcales bacterium]|nr:D-alanine--D-alanine ligase [Myxococcales bacterium]
MRIAFTHNLQLSKSEDEAEFDTPETVGKITDGLRSLGHDVEPIEVSGPASRVVARLEALGPDLVFNTAEGSHGRFREAFFPALFDRLGLPFTGSDAYTCALTLDKQLTKMLLTPHGITSPKGIVVHDLAALNDQPVRFPLIVKPNYEGSSMGITANSVVDSKDQLWARVVELLPRFPAGVLLEEFIVGRDIVVPFLERGSSKTGGVLEPASYRIDERVTKHRKYQVYDFELKTTCSDAVHVEVPAKLSEQERCRVMALAHTVFKVLGVHDLGRIDFRIAESGEVYFIEVNALPSLEQGASVYASGAMAGLNTPELVLEAVVRSAADRYGMPVSRSRMPRRRATLRIGLIFNLKSESASSHSDADAEFDSPETIAAIKEAIVSYGHEVLELQATPELPSILPLQNLDVVFNVAEGIEGRAREAQVPALLELLGIPYTGSDPTALSLALDKGLAKRLVRQAGFHTPEGMVIHTGKERIPPELSFPVIVKPLHEGSSKGIFLTNVAESESELRDLARQGLEKYRQPMLVETYLPGREFTVALLGEKRPRVLPAMEVLFTDTSDRYPVYSYAHKFEGRDIRFEVPANIDMVLHRELERAARGVFMALGCRDIARIDFRLDQEGRVSFVECNPLPGLTPGFSDLCVIAEAAGIDYRGLIGEILAPALRRYRERQKERRLERR